MISDYIYGLHPVNALLNAHPKIIIKLYILALRADHKIKTIVNLAQIHKIPIETLTKSVMEQRFVNFNHQGVVAKISNLPVYNEKDLTTILAKGKEPHLILILDCITDPHNLGACLRTAEAAGVNFVIIPKDKSASLTPAVSKVACGAAALISLIRVTNLVRAMHILKERGIWIYGASVTASESLYKLKLTMSLALVIGAEGTGIRLLTQKNCDTLFNLPMLGKINSLNASVATGISLYEVLRQRL